MLVVNKADFPVAIPYKEGRIIIQCDNRPHEIPDEFFNAYNDLLFCVRPPIIKEEVKPIVIPKKPLEDIRIKDDKFENKHKLIFGFKKSPRKNAGRPKGATNIKTRSKEEQIEYNRIKKEKAQQKRELLRNIRHNKKNIDIPVQIENNNTDIENVKDVNDKIENELQNISNEKIDENSGYIVNVTEEMKSIIQEEIKKE
jgi:hypothetical protein